MGCGCVNHTEVPVSNILYPEDYKELTGQYSGTGIKRTIAWTSSINESELGRLRYKFWRTRHSGSVRRWMAIRQAAEADAETALVLLGLAGLYPDNNSMEILYDRNGFIYNVPPFVLNHPTVEKVSLPKNTPEREIIRVKLRKFFDHVDKEIQVDNHLLVKDLKTEHEIQNARLFFGGKELNNDQQIWTYNLQNDVVIQMHFSSEDRAD